MGCEGLIESRVLVRAATRNDAADIAHVHVHSWRTTYAGIVPDSYLAALNEAERASQWSEWLTSEVEVMIAELDGKAVGFISGGVIREPIEGYDCELFAIYLLEEAQRRGIGSRLLEKLAAALMAKNFRSMVVWVLEDNPAKQFYVKCGATRIARKEIEIGGAKLSEAAYGWPDLSAMRTKA